MKKILSIFTILELLIVITIMTILATLFFPALQVAREKTKGISCLNNLKQCSLNISMYANDFNGYFPVRTVGGIDTWILFLKNNGYIKNHSFARCPSIKYLSTTPLSSQSGGSYYEIYGVRMSLGTDSTRCAKVWLSKYPSSSIILSDDIYFSGANDWRQLVNFGDYTSQHSYGSLIYLAHRNRANSSFIDGHAKNMPGSELGKLDDGVSKILNVRNKNYSLLSL